MTARQRRYAPIRFRKALPVVVNSRGSGARVLLSQLPAPRRPLYDAQMAAWQAGLELGRFSYLNSQYGVPVPEAVVAAWKAAADELEFQRWFWMTGG